MDTILLLEDEESLRSGICFKLEKEGYRVFSCGSVAEGKRLFRSHEIGLVLCDITLTDGSGISFCRYLREDLHDDVRFIFLTAMDSEVDIVMGYDTGADDYVTKPFSLAVLMSKVHSVFKRLNMRSDSGAGNGQTVFVSGKLTYYPNEMRLLVDHAPVTLTKNEYRLLQLFLNYPRQILSKTQILEQIFDADGHFVDDNTVAVNIRRLRAKILDSDDNWMIRNVRGMGYVWDCEVMQKM